MILLDLMRLLGACRGWSCLALRLSLEVLVLGGGTAMHAEALAQDPMLEEASAPALAPGPYRFEPGADVPALLIPRSERLVYRAYLDTGLVMTRVGTVTQICSVGEQMPSILEAEPAPAGEAASIQLLASGSYMLWEFESTLETRILPQEWPRLTYQSKSKGSQTRRREIQLGTKEEKTISSYRGDTKNGAPAGTRIWRPARERDVPAGTLDVLTAVFQARTLVREKKETLSFPLIDKDRLWMLVLRRGEEKRMETVDGTVFDVVEVVLEPGTYPGEKNDKSERFEGVFGINGSIHLWVEKKTGVAVRIQGDLPVGDFITVGIDVVLESYADTPPEFVPVSTPKKK